MVVLTFLVGHIADRFDRRRIVAACQFVECIVIALLTFGDRDGKLEVAVLFVAVALLGAARAFETPTMSALLPATDETSARPQRPSPTMAARIIAVRNRYRPRRRRN